MMGDKTSHRRKNPKLRNPVAQELATGLYHQKVIRDKTKDHHKDDIDYTYEDEDQP